MGSFSEALHAGVADVEREAKLIPRDLPSDTREAAAIAESAKSVAVTLDPELEGIFAAIGAAGDMVERGLGDLAAHASSLKKVLATRGVAPVAAPRPTAAAADASPAGSPAGTRKPTFSRSPRPSPHGAETSTAASSTPPTDGDPNAGSPGPTSELEQAERDLAALSPEDRAAFERAEHLDSEPF